MPLLQSEPLELGLKQQNDAANERSMMRLEKQAHLGRSSGSKEVVKASLLVVDSVKHLSLS